MSGDFLPPHPYTSLKENGILRWCPVESFHETSIELTFTNRAAVSQMTFTYEQDYDTTTVPLETTTMNNASSTVAINNETTSTMDIDSTTIEQDPSFHLEYHSGASKILLYDWERYLELKTYSPYNNESTQVRICR